ncbi:hypothetical protein TTHERM_01407940 (macronuclear) [Tetrahymena thermophila SB210]|uniref:Uncharacterized protein n=1 Tax=Tetrahymena thermophila (strain SB210) TaxID=312017 RepID=Q247V0_TETTS|nr:hypothetical protein TTHERM_01407940 [Tetrahymena thermophila SB210]EAS04056.2 hypothetical protein TTHERM_01407940 [Tetrahymena thermophila SB210]|eukprot:XP_001024301.2 hypothetical protein TTHERM_01407940 [Tetrahymena thermophila SB210]
MEVENLNSKKQDKFVKRKEKVIDILESEESNQIEIQDFIKNKQIIVIEDNIQFSPLFIQSNNDSSLTQNAEKNKTKPIKSVQIFKKIQKRQKRIQTFDILNPGFSEDEALNLFQGVQISNKGMIKFHFTTNQLSFGHLYNISHINYLKPQQLIVLDYQSQKPIKEISLEDALNYLSHSSCKHFLQASQVLKDFYQKQRYLKNILDSIKTDEQIIQLHNEQLDQYIQSCNQFISNYAKKNEGIIFQYFIARVNIEKKDSEIIKLGYSKSFLDLIGIDVTNFSSMLLRNHKINLFADEDEMTRQSLYGMNSNLQKDIPLKYINNIITLDGFKLQIFLQKQQIIPEYNFIPVSGIHFEYALTITNIDVDVNDLQNLINYRQRLVSQRNNLSYDDFIQRELSYLFENVEYSVHSSSFMEKYYHSNLENLLKLEELKQQQNQLVYAKRSYFKIIKKPNDQPSRI